MQLWTKIADTVKAAFIRARCTYDIPYNSTTLNIHVKICNTGLCGRLLDNYSCLLCFWRQRHKTNIMKFAWNSDKSKHWDAFPSVDIISYKMLIFQPNGVSHWRSCIICTWWAKTTGPFSDSYLYLFHPIFWVKIGKERFSRKNDIISARSSSFARGFPETEKHSL